MLEKTLVILKPCTLQRGLVGEITHRFERKGLRLAGMKMMQLTDELFVVSKVWMLFKLSVCWRVRQMDVWLPRELFVGITV